MANELTAMKEAYLKSYAEGYMEKIFYFCLKKCGSSDEAEELTSDISLAVIAGLEKGNPEHFSAWVWRIARNRYARWAAAKHKRSETVSGADLADYADFIADDSPTPEEALISKEAHSLLRRELAFIGEDYRKLLVAYYHENRRVEDIARSLDLPKGTVLTRLHRSRKLLKEGMNMAREFGVRSYKPEEVNFVNNGMYGKKGQPWSIVRHKLYKNIFLEAYGNPSTAETLAIELGIALPYMQDELDYLVGETLLVKNGDKYETAFPIISRSVQEQIHMKHIGITAELTALLERLVDTVNGFCETNGIAYYSGQTYEDAKWTMLMQAFDRFRWSFESGQRVYTERPDEGRWDIIGFQTVTYDQPAFVGCHGAFDAESEAEANEREEGYFQQFKYNYQDIRSKTPEHLTHSEEVALLRCAKGRASECRLSTLEKLCEYGYICKVGDAYEPAVVVYADHNIGAFSDRFDETTRKQVHELTEAIRAKFVELERHATELVQADLPERFRNDPLQCRLAITETGFDRGYVLEQALRDGWLKYDDQTSPVIGAHLYLE